jgi:hypothetical protein
MYKLRRMWRLIAMEVVRRRAVVGKVKKPKKPKKPKKEK